jgi:hypothetical protein
MPDIELDRPLARNAAPEGFVAHVFERDWLVDRPVDRVWRWLNDPRTFTETQVWPFRVEFINGGMETGVLNTHHGPLMSFTGVVGDVHPPGDTPGYRDLQYLYGSYAISLRLIRPTRLQFWVEAESPRSTRLRVRLDSLVSPRIAGLWTRAQSLFWSRFPKWAQRSA